MSAMVVVPTVPVLVWWKYARDDRQRQFQQVSTKVRVPNVQTIDDLMVEKCQPGDVILFDRRCEKCAAGPGAALACVLKKTLLCGRDDGRMRAVDGGAYDHCGIVVPGPVENEKDKYDPSNLLFLEATAGNGIIARPLLTRLEMSQSRSVILLPLMTPGERRYDDDYENPPRTQRMRDYITTQLSQFTQQMTEESAKQHYARAHSTLSIGGALAYGLNLHPYSSAPLSPSAWLVVQALQNAGVAEHISERTALETKDEDFLHDFRFCETDTVRLRPGFKFLPAVILRETSRS
jgi:hypothetical protein